MVCNFCSILQHASVLQAASSATSSGLLHSLGNCRSPPERNAIGGERHPAPTKTSPDLLGYRRSAYSTRTQIHCVGAWLQQVQVPSTLAERYSCTTR